MNIYPKKGIDQILFGMKPKHVEAVLGKPNKIFEDEESNKIYLFDDQKLSLTFYEEEDFRLGYITTTNHAATILDQKIIGMSVLDAKTSIVAIKNWNIEDFDTFEHHFNEDNWTILVSEFNEITKIEIGAVIVDDEFIWAFKG